MLLLIPISQNYTSYTKEAISSYPRRVVQPCLQPEVQKQYRDILENAPNWKNGKRLRGKLLNTPEILLQRAID